MKFVFRISGAWNFEILVEDSDIGGPSLIAVRIECLFLFQFWYVNSEWKTGDREGESTIVWGGWGVFKFNLLYINLYHLYTTI